MSDIPSQSTVAPRKTRKIMARMSGRGLAMLAIVLVPAVYLCWGYYERAKAIRTFIHGICAAKAVAMDNIYAGFAAQRDCLDRYEQTPYTLAVQSRQQILSELISTCENTSGAISTTDRLAQDMAKIEGRTPKSDRTICLEQIGAPLYP